MRKILALGLALTALLIYLFYPKPTKGDYLLVETNEVAYIGGSPEQEVIAQKLYEQAQTKYNPCSCVSFAKWETGINVGPIGMAKYHPINSDIPQVGGIVVLNDGRYGHLAAVIAVTNETITVKESNYIPCKVGTRIIERSSSEIKGYYNE